MAASTKPPQNAFVATARKVYNPLGFSHGYNFVLWFITAGALFGFTLARLMYLNFDGNFCNSSKVGGNTASPGTCYWFRHGHYRVGIIMHLASILPAALLVILQFIPIIRYKLTLLHRINGYIILVLLLIANAGALMITRRTFGGPIATQTAIGFLALITTFAAVKAYIAIRRLQIHKHRMWMMRTWVWAASIITLRIVMIIAAQIITLVGSYHDVFSCAELRAFHKGDLAATQKLYPLCLASQSAQEAGEVYVAVKASMGMMSENAGAALNSNFGMATWLALAIHAVLLEVYFYYTRGETERLKRVSEERRMQRRRAAGVGEEIDAESTGRKGSGMTM